MSTDTGSMQIQLFRLFQNLGGVVLPDQNSNSYSIQGWLTQINSLLQGNVSNWNTAYGWGDHAAAGYAEVGLDDYEEGTWTPVLNSSNGDATFTYVFQQGHYTKVGRLVTVTLLVQARATSIGTGGEALLENLPFAQFPSYIGRHGSAAFGVVSGFVTTQPTGVFYIENRTTSMYLSGITPSNFNTVSDMSLYGQFFFYTV